MATLEKLKKWNEYKEKMRCQRCGSLNVATRLDGKRVCRRCGNSWMANIEEKSKEEKGYKIPEIR